MFGDSEIGGFGGAVGVAECGARHGVGGEPEVGRAEPRCSAVGVVADVQRAVDGALGGGGVVVGAAEHAVFPAPSVSARIGGQTAVAGRGGELGQVDPVVRHLLQYRPFGHDTVGVEVDRDTQGGSSAGPRAAAAT